MSTSHLVTGQACQTPATRKNNPLCSDAFGAAMVSVEETKKLIIALAICAAPLASHAQQTDALISPTEAVSYQGEAGFNQPTPLRPRALVPQQIAQYVVACITWRHQVLFDPCLASNDRINAWCLHKTTASDLGFGRRAGLTAHRGD